MGPSPQALTQKRQQKPGCCMYPGLSEAEVTGLLLEEPCPVWPAALHESEMEKWLLCLLNLPVTTPDAQTCLDFQTSTCKLRARLEREAVGQSSIRRSLQGPPALCDPGLVPINSAAAFVYLFSMGRGFYFCRGPSRRRHPLWERWHCLLNPNPREAPGSRRGINIRVWEEAFVV